MKHAPKTEFADQEAPPKQVTMMRAIALAKDAVGDMTGLEPDSVTHCEKSEGDGWRVAIDVIESPARMGDNDFLATYEVQIGADAELQSFARLRRYHREERDS